MTVGMIEPQHLARRFRLLHVSDDVKGITRRRCGRGFCYFHANGSPVRDPDTLARIRGLVIPPAWQDVWICAHERGHLQATGRDDRGRKQYVYHEKWREKANLTKFAGLVPFAERLPRLRKAVREQLADPGLCCDKLLALLVTILDRTGMRVGNEEYAEENDSYGLTTLRKSHLHINGAGVEFRYRGKSGQKQIVAVGDGDLIGLIRECAALPGRTLFQYRGEKKVCAVTSYEINDYLRRIAGCEEISAKDFRTWKGTVLAAEFLYRHRDVAQPREHKRKVGEAVQHVAERLGNTPAVCKSYYIHPLIVESFLDGGFSRWCAAFQPRRLRWLSREEQFVVHCLTSSGKAADLVQKCA